MPFVIPRHCPRCSGLLDRSFVRWYERWRLLMSPARPFRCYTCRRRYWR
ncbi:MAG: hypothetical protein AB7P34_00410 [Vicinamibacterales bacterium]